MYPNIAYIIPDAAEGCISSQISLIIFYIYSTVHRCISQLLYIELYIAYTAPLILRRASTVGSHCLQHQYRSCSGGFHSSQTLLASLLASPLMLRRGAITPTGKFLQHASLPRVMNGCTCSHGCLLQQCSCRGWLRLWQSFSCLQHHINAAEDCKSTVATRLGLKHRAQQAWQLLLAASVMLWTTASAASSDFLRRSSCWGARAAFISSHCLQHCCNQWLPHAVKACCSGNR